MQDVTARVFAAMQNLDITALSTYPQNEIRPVLPALVRMSLLSPLDNTKSSMESRKQILAVLIGIEIVNSIVSYLQVNYHELEQELKKELQARQKSMYYDGQQEFGLQTGIALGFERADVTRKVRVVLSEIFNVQWQLSEQKSGVLVHSEILDDGIYLEEVVDILCIALAELPSLLNILELTDTLVQVPNGHRIICALVANFPDCYRDVITHVIINCDEESNEGKQKLMLLMALSEINPTQALSTRAICVEILKVPSFMLKLCLKYPQDLISFLTGMLLGNDQNVRTWFAEYVHSSQKRKGDALIMVRAELLQQLLNIMQMANCSSTEGEDYTVQGAVIMRLYCALRGIAGLKFNDDEVNSLAQLVTSRPQPSPSGMRFVSLALCMLIACPSLVSTTGLENKAIEWLQWLIKEDVFFGKRSDASTSLGEMLLLLAIHFHSNQISAIGELVCSTLAMKIPIRPNSTNRIKQVFTQDLFTEQVVASHAVRVPVTLKLNANIPGYLPVHCIHQLLKSRAFLKHKVPIKTWIYKQICNSVRPLHPVMPALIDVYVNTLIVPNPQGKVNVDHMHKSFSESEILHIFRSSNCGSHVIGDIISVPRIGGTPSNASETDDLSKYQVQCPLTAQLLMLYYLVLYEDTRISNLSNAALSGRKLKEYTNSFLSELPMKYLLQKAQQFHNEYVGIFHPLLRLIVSNYPHLSMVDDWLEEHCQSRNKVIRRAPNFSAKISESLKRIDFDKLDTEPGKAIPVLKALLKLPAEELAQNSDVIVRNLPKVFQQKVPRSIKNLYLDIWLRLNGVLPISFWRKSLASIMASEDYISRCSFVMDNSLDPLKVLRCSREVFQCPHTLIILLRILQGSLAASKAHLNIQMQSKQIIDKNGQVQIDTDREELKTALIASQESASVHILLEVLADMHTNSFDRVSSLELRETQGIICSFIHQSFISEPSLAKLVHFQTYPREVIPMMVKGVPSMHICIDFLHEFLSMPEMDKQVFTIDLTSHLVLKYAIPKSLSVSKFCINTIQSALSLLSTEAKCKYLRNILPSLIRFAEAFPILTDDCVNILMLTGRSLYSQSTLGINSTQMQLTANSRHKCFKEAPRYIAMIEEAFETLITKIVNKVELY
ncbi:integrator complex subunit 2 [Stomoxys calcitrans]|uniref:integrator complex subunit 2 n=1 Tax=Stomoxys calcitrans TaxID=35570 RepID=UPI0027E2951A|nr:integrator complex subunit 2 [Stomoxys calcitrans]